MLSLGEFYMLGDHSELVRLLAEIFELASGPIAGWPRGRVSLNEHEAAESIGVPQHVLRDLRLRQKLSYTKVGRCITYRPEQLKALLDQLQCSDSSTIETKPQNSERS